MACSEQIVSLFWTDFKVICTCMQWRQKQLAIMASKGWCFCTLVSCFCIERAKNFTALAYGVCKATAQTRGLWKAKQLQVTSLTEHCVSTAFLSEYIVRKHCNVKSAVSNEGCQDHVLNMHISIFTVNAKLKGTMLNFEISQPFLRKTFPPSFIHFCVCFKANSHSETV